MFRVEETPMRRALVIGAALASVVVGAAAWWRRHPRVGATWVNRVVNPWLVRQGAVEGARGELGLLEHVGRRSGTVRISPIHPVRTPEGFRIIVPLGVQSQWALNVVAAGRCRLQVDGVVHELDEPRLVAPFEVEAVPWPMARVMGWLGFRYLVLRQFAAGKGTLGAPVAESPISESPVVAEGTPTEAVPIA
jgi:deazaflavin-dependent oxidoreductase (nitroreductase family)